MGSKYERSKSTIYLTKNTTTTRKKIRSFSADRDDHQKVQPVLLKRLKKSWEVSRNRSPKRQSQADSKDKSPQCLPARLERSAESSQRSRSSCWREYRTPDLRRRLNKKYGNPIYDGDRRHNSKDLNRNRYDLDNDLGKSSLGKYDTAVRRRSRYEDHCSDQQRMLYSSRYKAREEDQSIRVRRFSWRERDEDRRQRRVDCRSGDTRRGERARTPSKYIMKSAYHQRRHSLREHPPSSSRNKGSKSPSRSRNMRQAGADANKYNLKVSVPGGVSSSADRTIQADEHSVKYVECEDIDVSKSSSSEAPDQAILPRAFKTPNTCSVDEVAKRTESLAPEQEILPRAYNTCSVEIQARQNEAVAPALRPRSKSVLGPRIYRVTIPCAEFNTSAKCPKPSSHSFGGAFTAQHVCLYCYLLSDVDKEHSVLECPQSRVIEFRGKKLEHSKSSSLSANIRKRIKEAKLSKSPEKKPTKKVIQRNSPVKSGQFRSSKRPWASKTISSSSSSSESSSSSSSDSDSEPSPPPKKRRIEMHSKSPLRNRAVPSNSKLALERATTELRFMVNINNKKKLLEIMKNNNKENIPRSKSILPVATLGTNKGTFVTSSNLARSKSVIFSCSKAKQTDVKKYAKSNKVNIIKKTNNNPAKISTKAKKLTKLDDVQKNDTVIGEKNKYKNDVTEHMNADKDKITQPKITEVESSNESYCIDDHSKNDKKPADENIESTESSARTPNMYCKLKTLPFPPGFGSDGEHKDVLSESTLLNPPAEHVQMSKKGGNLPEPVKSTSNTPCAGNTEDSKKVEEREPPSSYELQIFASKEDRAGLEEAIPASPGGKLSEDAERTGVEGLSMDLSKKKVAGKVHVHKQKNQGQRPKCNQEVTRSGEETKKTQWENSGNRFKIPVMMSSTKFDQSASFIGRQSGYFRRSKSVYPRMLTKPYK